MTQKKIITRKKTKPKNGPVSKKRHGMPRKKAIIQVVSREYSSGGIVYRQLDNKEYEFLLIQDLRGRWSIPKGHIETGENSSETALREITEETGLKSLRLVEKLDDIYFTYRFEGRIIYMTTFVYMVENFKNDEAVSTEDLSWMVDVKWFKATDAIKSLKYPALNKLLMVTIEKLKVK